MRHFFRGEITNHQYVRPDKRELARALRRRGTASERAAWALLRGRGMLGLKFRRQQVIDGFVVDFFCAERLLVVEIDGGVHGDPEVADYDRSREVTLHQRGLSIVRLRNEEVDAERLSSLIRAALSAESPPLPKGEGDGG